MKPSDPSSTDPNSELPEPTTITVSDGALIPERRKRGLLTSWRIAFFGALILLVLLPVLNSEYVVRTVLTTWYSVFPVDPAHPDLTLKAIQDGTYRDHYWRALVFVPDGLVITFEVTVLAILSATMVGLLAGLGQISRNRFLNRLAVLYVEIIRGIPLVVQIFYVYYSLGQFFKMQGVFAAVVAMTVCYGAYMGEIFRAGIQSIPKGQMEASLALGLTRKQALLKIILPQTVRVILPAIGNEFIALLKDSSLVSILALTDLMQRGKQYTSRTFAYFETFTIVALIYLVLTLFLSRLVAIMEERLHRGRR